jgi:hypothetical protein
VLKNGTFAVLLRTLIVFEKYTSSQPEKIYDQINNKVK